MSCVLIERLGPSSSCAQSRQRWLSKAPYNLRAISTSKPTRRRSCKDERKGPLPPVVQPTARKLRRKRRSGRYRTRAGRARKRTPRLLLSSGLTSSSGLLAIQRKTDMNRLAGDFESAVGEIIETVSSASTSPMFSVVRLRPDRRHRRFSPRRSRYLETAIASSSKLANSSTR